MLRQFKIFNASNIILIIIIFSSLIEKMKKTEIRDACDRLKYHNMLETLLTQFPS